MMGVATLAPWQHSSPTGGFISTDRVFGPDLQLGMVVRVSRPNQAMWQGITTLESRLGIDGVIVTIESGFRLWLMTTSAVEVRRDCRLEQVDIAPCGCWDTSHLQHGGIWTCDMHLALRKRGFQPLTAEALNEADWKQLAEDSLTRTQHGLPVR